MPAVEGRVARVASSMLVALSVRAWPDAQKLDSTQDLVSWPPSILNPPLVGLAMCSACSPGQQQLLLLLPSSPQQLHIGSNSSFLTASNQGLLFGGSRQLFSSFIPAETAASWQLPNSSSSFLSLHQPQQQKSSQLQLPTRQQLAASCQHHLPQTAAPPCPQYF